LRQLEALVDLEPVEDDAAVGVFCLVAFGAEFVELLEHLKRDILGVEASDLLEDLLQVSQFLFVVYLTVRIQNKTEHVQNVNNLLCGGIA